MTNILALNSSGALVEVDHASATTAIICASDGVLSEIEASGTHNVIALNSSGVLTEISIEFASFTGPADGVSGIYAAYSTRRLLTAYTGAALRVQRSSDNTEQDIGFTSGGDLDTSALSTFVGSGSGYLVKWYDQSGNARDLTPIASNYARIVDAGAIETVNSRACIRGTASNQRYRYTLTTNFNSTTSEMFSVWSSTGVAYARLITFNPTGGTDWSSVGGWVPAQSGDAGTNRSNYAYYGGTSELACSADELAVCYSNHTSNQYLFIAKGAYTASVGARPYVNSKYINLGTSDGSTNHAPVGYWCEAVVTNTIQSDYTAFKTNQEDYWGI